MTATIIVVLFGAAYLFGTFFAIRRECGTVTFARLIAHRNPTPLELIREVKATNARNLRHIDRSAFFAAYLIVVIFILLGVLGVALRLTR